ncbi:MAG: hypothetical protein WC723_03540 [Candidatus Omnitrophota bacterium]
MRKLGFLVVFILGLFNLCLAAEESITITTYYPSPYGSYNQVEVHRSVTYKPVDKNTLDDPKEGELVYNSSDDSLYLYNGSTWVKQGGGSTCVVTYNSVVGSCSCPSGWTLKLDLGPWGYCYSTYYRPAFFRPPGGGCPSDSNWGGSGTNIGASLGEGCFCCQN